MLAESLQQRCVAPPACRCTRRHSAAAAAPVRRHRTWQPMRPVAAAAAWEEADPMPTSRMPPSESVMRGPGCVAGGSVDGLCWSAAAPPVPCHSSPGPSKWPVAYTRLHWHAPTTQAAFRKPRRRCCMRWRGLTGAAMRVRCSAVWWKKHRWAGAASLLLPAACICSI